MRQVALVGRGLLLAIWAGWAAASVGVAQEKTEAATRQYNLAVGLQNSGAYDLAAQEWTKFLQQNKKDPRIDRAWHYLGVCYAEQNKLDKAVEAFETVIKSFAKFELLADTYLNFGLTQYNIACGGKPEMYDKAAETFRTLAKNYPAGKHLIDAIFYEGECLYNRGKKKEAAERYATIVQKYPTHPVYAKALFALGVTQTEIGQHQAALETYDTFLKKFADNSLAPEATMWRGESLFATGKHAEAAKAYAAAAAAPGFAMADYATVRQADALAAQKQFAEAAALYAAVPAKFPKSQYVRLCDLEAGKKYYAAGDYAKAQESLAKALAAGGDTAVEAAHWSARTLLKQNRPAEALALVDKTLKGAEKSPMAATLMMDRADATYEAPGRRGESIDLYQAVAAKYPNDPVAPQALYLAAFAAMTDGQYQKALGPANEFLKAHPKHELAVGAMHVLAESQLLLGNAAEAESLYQQLLQKAPNDRDAEIWKVHLGTAVFLQKKYPETIAGLEAVMPQIKTPDLVAEGWYRIGRSQMALNQYEAAIKSLEASLKAAPKWKLADDTQVVLAYAYQQTNNLAKAQEVAQKVIQDFPTSKLLDAAHYRLGECARLAGDPKKAATEYQLVAKGWPESSLARQALYGLGWAQLGLGDYAAAETTFTALVDKPADDKLILRAHYGRGFARRQLKKFAPAIEDLQAVLAKESDPAEKARARHVLGLAQAGLNQYDQAAATFRSLLSEDPGYSDADGVYFELGWALKSGKKDAEAADAFAKLGEKYPDSKLAADAQYFVGDFAYEKKDYQKAAAAYFAAMNKAGKAKLGEEATYKLALSYFLLEDYSKAQQTLTYQRGNWPDGPLASDAAFLEAECLFKQEKFADALPVYALVKKPANKEIEVLALLHSAQAAGQIKDWKKSLELAAKCVEQFPDSPYASQALYEQGWVQQNLGKPEEALVIYQKVIDQGKNDEAAARAQFMIGEILFEQKKHDDAIKAFFKVSYGYGLPQWQADATYEAARCFEVLGKKPQALKQYEQLIEKFPKSDKVPIAKERIKALKG